MSSSPTSYSGPSRRRSSSSSNPPFPQLGSARLAASPAAAAIAAASPSSPDLAEDADDVLEDDYGGRSTSPDLPLTITASAILSQLPRDATAALAEAGTFPPDLKVVVRFKPVGGNAPPLRKELSKISASQKFEAVVLYLRRMLKVSPTDSVFLYVNSTFAPALDEIVGNLHRCFKDSNGQLNVSYSMTPAFG